jgi:hypothetical protein
LKAIHVGCHNRHHNTERVYKPHSQETRDKIRTSLAGRRLTDPAKLSEGQRRSWASGTRKNQRSDG